MNRSALDLGVRIERITDLPGDFDRIVYLALQEMFGALRRMREEWDSGLNRFDRAGEAVFAAGAGSRLVGICGLNRDPYARSPGIGRVRHLYVDPAFRRRGIGRQLVSTVIDCAGLSFDRVRLRTSRADADLFYVALGFRRVEGEPDVTHERTAPVSTARGRSAT